MAVGYRAGLLTQDILEHTPGEIYSIAAARAEHETKGRQVLAYLTASLGGFSKLKPFETYFPDKKPAAPKRNPTIDDYRAFFGQFRPSPPANHP